MGSLAYSHETHTGQSGICEGSLKREVLWVGTLNLWTASAQDLRRAAGAFWGAAEGLEKQPP